MKHFDGPHLRIATRTLKVYVEALMESVTYTVWVHIVSTTHCSLQAESFRVLWVGWGIVGRMHIYSKHKGQPSGQLVVMAFE